MKRGGADSRLLDEPNYAGDVSSRRLVCIEKLLKLKFDAPTREQIDFFKQRGWKIPMPADPVRIAGYRAALESQTTVFLEAAAADAAVELAKRDADRAKKFPRKKKKGAK